MNLLARREQCNALSKELGWRGEIALIRELDPDAIARWRDGDDPYAVDSCIRWTDGVETFNFEIGAPTAAQAIHGFFKNCVYPPYRDLCIEAIGSKWIMDFERRHWIQPTTEWYEAMAEHKEVAEKRRTDAIAKNANPWCIHFDERSVEEYTRAWYARWGLAEPGSSPPPEPQPQPQPQPQQVIVPVPVQQSFSPFATREDSFLTSVVKTAGIITLSGLIAAMLKPDHK